MRVDIKDNFFLKFQSKTYFLLRKVTAIFRSCDFVIRISFHLNRTTSICRGYKIFMIGSKTNVSQTKLNCFIVVNKMILIMHEQGSKKV
jgi:hypothetical protein